MTRSATPGGPETEAGRELLADASYPGDADYGVRLMPGDELVLRILAIEAEARALAATASPGPSQDDIEAKVDDIVERYGGALDALASPGLDVATVADLRNAAALIRDPKDRKRMHDAIDLAADRETPDWGPDNTAGGHEHWDDR